MGLALAIDKTEAKTALAAVFADPRLCAEADKFFLGEEALYEPGGLLSYFFVVPGCTADEAHGQHAAFRRRDDAERLAVLCAPEKYGLVRHRVCSPVVRETDDSITPAMIEAGARLLSDAILDLRDGFLSPSRVVIALYRAMELQRLSEVPR